MSRAAAGTSTPVTNTGAPPVTKTGTPLRRRGTPGRTGCAELNRRTLFDRAAGRGPVPAGTGGRRAGPFSTRSQASPNALWGNTLGTGRLFRDRYTDPQIGSDAIVLAVLGVLVLGLGLGACGLLESDMYIVAAEVLFIGAVGLVVRAVDLSRWWRS
jgi:hypothetical protein